jgi:membrane fusion protein
MRPLFRQEAIDAQREKLLGAVSAARPVPLRVFTALAAACAITLVVFAFWGEYTRRERVEGFIATDVGEARVLAPAPAVVEELLVKEGAEVAEGTPIAKLTLTGQGRVSGKELDEQRQRIEAEIASARQLARQEEEQVRGRIAAFTSERDQSAGEIELQTARVASADAEVKRTAKLVREGFFSPAELTKRENELLDQQSKLQQLRRQRTGVERDLANARSELSAIQIKLSEKVSQLERKLSELRAQGSLAGMEIRAPTAGVVTKIAVSRGESVAGDAPIATVLPKGSLRAQLLVPTRASGFIRAGNKVVLRYDAFPFQRFGQYGGLVDDVSRTVWSAGERVGAMVAREPVYRVDVKLDRQTVMAGGQEMPLRPGMALSADILLEKRTVFEWVFEPVLELRGRLQ